MITEIMADSNAVVDDMGEWFEVYNPSATQTYDMFNCLLADMSNQNIITSHVMVHPNQHVTFARFPSAAVGGFPPTYDYHTTLDPTGTMLDAGKDVKFSNSGDQAKVTCGVNVIDIVNFTAWTVGGAVPHGKSYSLDPAHYSASDNDIEANWCTGTTNYSSLSGIDLGTPNEMNPPCTCMAPSCLPW